MSNILRALVSARKGLDRFILGVHSWRYIYAGFFGAITSGYLFNTYCFELANAHGQSMYPTIPDGITLVLMNKTYRYGRGVQIGDCIQVESPVFRSSYLNKRIVGMPGDYVLRSKNASQTPGGAPVKGLTDWKTRKRMAVDSGPDVERWIAEDQKEEEEWEEPEMIQVPEGHVWVEGDNLAWSRDSRFFGPVPMAMIKGRASCFSEGWFTWQSLYPGKGLRKVPDDEIAAVLGEDKNE